MPLEIEVYAFERWNRIGQLRKGDPPGSISDNKKSKWTFGERQAFLAASEVLAQVKAILIWTSRIKCF